jgi:hypothetical protein
MKGIREMKGSFLVENIVLHHLSQFRVANTAWCHTHALMLFKVWTHKAHLKIINFKTQPVQMQMYVKFICDFEPFKNNARMKWH